MSNPLSSLKIEKWWHAFTAVGACGMVASLAIKTEAITQKESLLLFLGLFLFGIGQWINHPIQQTLGPGIIITGHHRHSSFLGVVFEILGGAIFAIDVFRILFP